MKAQCSQVAEGSQVFTFVSAEQAVSVILHNSDAMTVGDIEDCVHFTPDSGVMHRHDNFRAWSDQPFQLSRIHVQRVGADIYENWSESVQHKGIDRGNEGE